MPERQRRRNLPYISRAERDRANWRTLPEVVAHVVRVDGCQSETARSQIGAALASGDLWPLCWEDWRPSPSGPTGGAAIPFDVPSRKWSKTEIEKIDWVDGTAFDRSEYGFLKKQGRRLMFRRRRLLIYRLAIAQWWPESAPSRPKPTAAELDAWMRQHVTRGTKRDDAIADCRKATGATFREAAAAHKRLPEKFKMKRGQRVGSGKIAQ
jgi:hypothetical protein